MRNKIFVFCTLLFSITVLTAQTPIEKSADELTYNKATTPVCIVMVIVKVDKFMPFIRIIDSRRRLLKADDVTKIECVTWWNCHTRKYSYESVGGDFPIKI